MATKPRIREKMAGQETEGFQVVAKRGSFWRAGIHFTSEPKTIPLSDLTEAQAEQIWLEGNPPEGQPPGQLVVVKVNIQAPQEPAA